MSRSLATLVALLCAGCITQTEVPPAPDVGVDADMTVVDADTSPTRDADVPMPPPPDRGASPILDMGAEIWDATPPDAQLEPEAGPEPEPRWRPDGVIMDRQDVLPLAVVCVDAADYLPAEVIQGQGWAYEWQVVAQPDGARTTMVERHQDPRRPADTGIPDNVRTPHACVFIPSAGEYTIELTLHDRMADAAEVVVRMDVAAMPDQDIHIALTWDTPGDADQTDADGTDVDLHLRHPRAQNWAQAPNDCYYANASPDWGPSGPEGNPSLDIDDVNGAGPEHINLDAPEDTNEAGGLYRIGVDYYRADNFATGGSWGHSVATVRVFIGGELAYEGQRDMLGTRHFWTVAAIEWIDGVGRVIEINQYYNQVP